MAPVIAMKNLIVKSANDEEFTEDLEKVSGSVFGKDFDIPRLKRHLAMLNDIIHQALPEVKRITSTRTVCSAMLLSNYRSTFTEIHKLLRLYLTVPITSATSERAFSTLRRVFTNLRSTMTEKRLNNCVLFHVHKDIVDELDLVPIARSFVSLNEERIRHFGSFT